jgi:hypothetical protein
MNYLHSKARPLPKVQSRWYIDCSRYVCVCVGGYLCVCSCVCVCVLLFFLHYIDIYRYIDAYVHMYVYILYIHTHSCNNRPMKSSLIVYICIIYIQSSLIVARTGP